MGRVINAMETLAMKTIVGRFYDEVWNKRDKSVISALLQPDFTFRGCLGRPTTGQADFIDLST